jgi:hypothetical protein
MTLRGSDNPGSVARVQRARFRTLAGGTFLTPERCPERFALAALFRGFVCSPLAQSPSKGRDGEGIARMGFHFA